MKKIIMVEDLFRNHAKRIHRKLVGMGCSPEDAEDIMQEAYIIAIEKFDQLKDEEAFVSWFSAIAIRMVYKNTKKKRERVMVELSEFLDTEISRKDWESFVITNDMASRIVVREALTEIPEKYRIPLCLSVVENYKYIEIASILEIEEGTVKSRIYRAKAMLRALLSQDFLSESVAEK